MSAASRQRRLSRSAMFNQASLTRRTTRQSSSFPTLKGRAKLKRRSAAESRSAFGRLPTAPPPTRGAFSQPRGRSLRPCREVLQPRRMIRRRPEPFCGRAEWFRTAAERFCTAAKPLCGSVKPLCASQNGSARLQRAAARLRRAAARLRRGSSRRLPTARRLLRHSVTPPTRSGARRAGARARRRVPGGGCRTRPSGVP